MANSLKSSLKNRMEGIADLIWPRITGPKRGNARMERNTS